MFSDGSLSDELRRKAHHFIPIDKNVVDKIRLIENKVVEE